MLKKTLSNCLCVQGLIFFAHRCQARSPKTTLKFGGAGLISSSIYGSTVLIHWVHWVHWPGLSKHLPAHLQAWSPPGNGEGLLSLSLSLSLQMESVTKSLSELPIACLVCFTFSFCFCISQHFSLPVKFFCWSKTTRLVLWRLAVWTPQWSEIWLVCALKACQLSICFIHVHTKK